MLYLKYGGIAAALILLCSTFYHLGGNAARAAAASAHAAQLGTVVSALEAQRNAAQAESDRRQGIINAYDESKDVPDPVVAGLARRVYVYAARAGCPAVPGARPVASGITDAAPLPGSDTSLERLSKLTQAALDAAESDARQMNAMIDFITTRKRAP